MADENIYDEFKEAIPVMSGDTMDIAIDEAFAPIGQSNSELNHAVLNNRDIPNQHPITAIEGLRDELNNIENLKTEYSDEMGFANYYPWEDGGDSKYSRIGYFVTVADRERRIKICTESDEVFGVTVVTAGFIGNQDGIPDNDDYSKYGTKKGSNCGVEYGLVAHSGVVNVHCRSDVVKGSHVICDNDGYAKVVPEEDGGYGFKVIGIDWKNGEKYAVISLDASINQLHALGKEALEIRNRMTGLEKNVTTAVNAANQALSKVNEIGEVSQGVAGKVDEIANVVDKNNQQIADTTNKVNQAVQQAQQAQQVAQEISNQVAENAKVEIQQLKDDVSKAQDVANKAQSTADSAFLNTQNTKEQVRSEVVATVSQQFKDSIDNFNEKFITIEGKVDENNNSITDLTAALNMSYQKVQSWNNNGTYTSLDGKINQTAKIDTVYYSVGDEKFHYYKDETWQSSENILDTGLVASIAMVQQQVNKNEANINSVTQVSNENKESISAIKQHSDENESMINLLCSFTGDNYEKVADFEAIDKNILVPTKVYYCEKHKKFRYFKDGEWKATTNSYEAGITDAIANLKMIANDKESITQILNTYIGKNVVDAVMCDSQPNLSNMKSGVKYCYQQDESSYICQFTDGKSAYTYPEDSDLDNISNVVLNAVKEIDNYTTVDTWTNDLEDSTEYTKIYYVKDQDKYYHYHKDTSKSAWLPMDISFYFTYDTVNKCWNLTDSTSISFMKAISLIQSKADANGARLDVLLSGNKEDSNSLAAMIAEATGDTALMQMLTQWVDKSGVVEVKDEFDENTADKDKVYYAQGKASELKFLTDNLILMPYDNNVDDSGPNTADKVDGNGIHFKANLDGSIDVWGKPTLSENTIYYMRNYNKNPISRFTINSGTYTIGLTTSELPPDFDPGCIRLSTNLYNGDTAIYAGSSATVSISEPREGCTINLLITSNFKNIDESNPIRVYPMLNLGSKLKSYTCPRVATTDDKEITLYYYYSNDHWLSTTDPSVAGVSNSLATLKVKSDKHGGEIEGLVKDTRELGTKLSRITQRADGIESLVANIDKYSVGEYSQAYGLSLEQANNILYDGMVFIPTKTVVEKYELEIEELSEEEYNKAFAAVQNNTLDTEFNDKDKKRQYHYYYDNDNGEIKDRYFYYNGANWVFSGDPGYKNQSLISNCIYQWGDNEAYGCKMWIDTGETAFATTDNNTVPETTKVGQFWYYNGSVPISITNDKTGETKVYEPKALYKYVVDETDSTIKYWTKVASAKDMFNTRSLSQIRQKSNEIALEVSDTKGSVATLKNTVDNLGAHTALVVDYEGKVKAYMLGDATESGSQWQIGATNINIDGTITVTNTYNTDRKGTFKIYDFADRNSSNNYWLRADLADGTTPFSVDETGRLTATNADITGKITATDGEIGGWNISSTYIGGELIGETIDIKSWKWPTGSTPAQYSIDGTNYYDADELNQYHCKSGTIDFYYNSYDSDWIESTTLENNKQQSLYILSPINDTEYWIKTELDNDIKFSVSRKGKLVAKNADIGGRIVATSGNIGGWNVTSDGIELYPDYIVPIIDIKSWKWPTDSTPAQYSIDGVNYYDADELKCYKLNNGELAYYYYYSMEGKFWTVGSSDPNYGVKLSTGDRFGSILCIDKMGEVNPVLKIDKPGMIVTETGLFSGHQHYRTMLKGAYSGKRFMSSVGIYTHDNPNVAVELYDPENKQVHCSVKIERNNNTNGVITIYGFKQSGKTYATSPALELRSDGVYYGNKKLAFANQI